MSVYVECICGKKYEIDPEQVQKFDCEGCKRHLQVPSPKLASALNQLRERMKQGVPGLRDAMTKAAAMRNFHAISLLKQGAESGEREPVNIALTGLVDFPGPGHEVLAEWIKSGALGPSRLVTALREQKYEGGADFICELAEKGVLKESQLAEVAPYLGKSNSHRALRVLKEARRKYPNLGGLLDSALANMRELDETAGDIPDEAKRIPGREGSARADEVPEKKGCMGLLLAILVAVGMLSTLIATL
jgi:hypothetical protein